MRSIKTLLEVMLQNKCLFKSGLCQWVYSLYVNNKITYPELDRLTDYIRNNRPEKDWSVSSFLYLNKPYLSFYWKSGKLYPRVQWIKKHIKLN